MDITARVAAMGATVEAERKAMESRLQKLEETVSKGVARALAWLAALALSMVGGVIAINVQLVRTEERQLAGDARHGAIIDEMKRRISDNERRLDRLELHTEWPQPELEEDAPAQRRTRQSGVRR